MRMGTQQQKIVFSPGRTSMPGVCNYGYVPLSHLGNIGMRNGTTICVFFRVYFIHIHHELANAPMNMCFVQSCSTYPGHSPWVRNNNGCIISVHVVFCMCMYR